MISQNHNLRKLLSLLLTAAMLLTMGGVVLAAGDEDDGGLSLLATSYPQPEPVANAERQGSSVGAYQTFHGYYTHTLTVNGVEREIEFYIPEGARQREYWIAMALPSLTDSTAFLNISGWMDIADETLACLLILKPEDGVWGDAEAELPYINTAMLTLASSNSRAPFYSAFTYDYVVGYGDGALPLQLWAASNPLRMISQAYVNAESDEAFDALLHSAGDTQVGATPQPNHMDFVGYSDKDGNAITQLRTFEAMYNKDMPIPTAFFGKASDSLVAYWKGVNDARADAEADETYGSVYWQTSADSRIATVTSGVLSRVSVNGAKVSNIANAEMTRNIYDFLSYYSGYDNNSCYGHFITKRLQYTNHDTEVEGGCMIYRDHMYGNTNRTWMAYIPDSIADKSAAPLLVTTHGAGQTAFVFMDATDVKNAADQYGFVALTYDYTGNADYMVELLSLAKEACAEKGVTIDESRIYAYGQSAGGGAVGNTLAKSPKTVDLFAAFSMTSGTSTSAAKAGDSAKFVPMYAIYGEYDYWPMKVGPVAAGDFCGSQGARQANSSANTQTYWANRLLGKTLDELIDPASYTLTDGLAGSYEAQNTPITLITNPTETANRYRVYTWSRDYGGGEVPIFVWAQCYGRGHNLVPGDLNQLWENWFSKWQKSEKENTLLYWADGIGNGTPVAVEQVPSLDSYTKALDINYSRAARQPLSGYFTKSVSGAGVAEGRTVKVYLSDYAPIRSYMTVVAIPDGAETYSFLKDNGWFDVIDAQGEILLALEPGEGGWGTPEEELAYVNAAITGNNGTPVNNKNRVGVFSTFGENYVVGYGKGASAVEYWAAQNPILVISQAYLNGESIGSEQLTAAASTEYTGKSSNGDISAVLDETLAQVAISGKAAPKDVPVPTLLAAYTGSEAYWKQANDATVEQGGGVFAQDINSDAYQTHYANSERQQAGETTGLSEVRITGEASADAAALFDWMVRWSRYDTTFPYSNQLAPRINYSPVRVAAQKAAENSRNAKTLSDGTTKLLGSSFASYDGADGGARLGVGVVAFADNNNDGQNDPREYILYIPESAQGKKAPVMMVYPGNSQTDSIFLDSTLWWNVADQYGFAVAVVCETYNRGGVTVSHYNNDGFYHALITVLKDVVPQMNVKEGTEIDFTRVYGSGQSAGSSATQGFAINHPEFFAAVASTSAASTPGSTATYELMPTMMFSGQMDVGSMAKGFEDTTGLVRWGNYFLQADGIDAEFTAEGASSVEALDTRHAAVYTWSKNYGGVEVPLLRWGQCLLRPHNPYPTEPEYLWQFASHFSRDEDGNRFYSPSAFEEDDLILLNGVPVTDIDTVETVDIDYSQSAQIPLEGWYRKTLPSGREVDLYFSTYAACRAYYTIVAIPDGVANAQAWAEQQGYVDLMEERGEVLVLLKPASGGWGDTESEYAYVSDAMDFVAGGKNAYGRGLALFTEFNTFYLIGYGGGSKGLEAWAAEYPIKVAGQAYVGGSSVGAAYLAEVGAKKYNGVNTSSYNKGIYDDDEFTASLIEHGYVNGMISRSEVPVPTWIAGGDMDESIAYWKSASDCLPAADADGVFWQAKDSDAIQTEYANACTEEAHGISRVKVTSGEPTAAELTAFLYELGRYNIPFAYSNHLHERHDYAPIRAQAQAIAQSAAYLSESQKREYGTTHNGLDAYYVLGEAEGSAGNGTVRSIIAAFSNDGGDAELDAREFLMYIPACAGENAPVLLQFPGMTQSVAVGYDSTQWWRIADQTGMIVVIIGEAYNNGVALSWKNADLAYYAIMDYLKNEVDGKNGVTIDFARVYGSGHSLGSSQVQGFARTHPEFFAAVGSTSFQGSGNGVNKEIPVMLMTGQADIQGLMSNLWTSNTLKSWFTYLAGANKLKVSEASIDNADVKNEGQTRMWTYVWNNEKGIPMVSWGQTYMRDHNCYPAEIPVLWDYIEHYSLAEDGSRYYSPSAFAEDDLILINGESVNAATVEVSGAAGAGVNTVGVSVTVKALRDLGAVVLGMEYADGMILKEVRGVDWQAGDANLVLNRDIDAGETDTITLIFEAAPGATVDPNVTIIVRAVAGQDEQEYAVGVSYSGAGALCGDANADGKLSAGDLVRLRNYIGMNGENITVGPGADVNGDGAVNGLDLTALNRYFATTAL